MKSAAVIRGREIGTKEWHGKTERTIEDGIDVVHDIVRILEQCGHGRGEGGKALAGPQVIGVVVQTVWEVSVEPATPLASL